MHLKNKFIFKIASSVFIAGLTVNANANNLDRIVIAPKCLIAQESIKHQVLASHQNFSLISLKENQIDKLVEIKNQKRACGGFRDVTLHWQQSNIKALSSKAATDFLIKETTQPHSLKEPNQKKYKIRNPETTNRLIGTIQPQTMWSNLTTLTQFKDRYSRSDNGVKAAAWFKSKMEEMIAQSGRHDVSVQYIKTGRRYPQPSILVKLGNSNAAGVVIGAHMDTLNSAYENKPGADDDGSGSVTVLELARVLLNSGITFNKPIYLVWYAAEEVGLVGSGYVVSHFRSNHIPVEAVLHFDMTGYAYKNDPTIWLINDYVNQSLTQYVEQLVKTYVKQPVQYTSCGYACSDHASWTQGGFKSAFPFEAQFGRDNPYIHTSRDTISVLSLTHMTDYAKLGVAFAAELGLS